MKRNGPTCRPARRPGVPSLLLLALTVQFSLMLEWAGPGSADTRERLATAIVAAAHQGVFTERAPEPASIPAPEAPRSGAPWRCGPGPAADLGTLRAGWRSALPPPAV